MPRKSREDYAAALDALRALADGKRRENESEHQWMERQIAVLLAAGWTKKDVADRAGVHPSEVSRLLSGERQNPWLISTLEEMGVEVPEHLQGPFEAAAAPPAEG